MGVNENLDTLFGTDSDYTVVDTVETAPDTDFPIESVKKPPLPVDTEKEKAEIEKIKADMENDYAVARKDLKKIIENGWTLYSLASDIAHCAQDPKSIDSATKILNSLATFNEKLMTISQQRQDIVVKSRDRELIKQAIEMGNTNTTNINPQTVNNTLYVGTAKDLNKILKELNIEKIAHE